MGEIVPMTWEIEKHLPELTGSDEELRAEVRLLLRSIDARRARGWHKVPYRELARLRVLVGVPEPEHPYSELP